MVGSAKCKLQSTFSITTCQYLRYLRYYYHNSVTVYRFPFKMVCRYKKCLLYYKYGMVDFLVLVFSSLYKLV